jgi:hypothetical protein
MQNQEHSSAPIRKDAAITLSVAGACNSHPVRLRLLEVSQLRALLTLAEFPCERKSEILQLDPSASAVLRDRRSLHGD